MSLVETTREEWSPENWRERYKAVRARVTIHRIPARIRLAADLYAFPIGPRWHTSLYDHPIGPSLPIMRDLIDLRRESFRPTSFSQMLGGEIIDYICALREVSKAELLGPRRAGPVIKVRHEVTHLIKSTERYSYPSIGRLMGGRDHTTSLNSVRKWQALLDAGLVQPTEFDADIAAEVCRKRLHGVVGGCNA